MQALCRSHAKRAARSGHVLKRTCHNRVRCFAHFPTRTPVGATQARTSSVHGPGGHRIGPIRMVAVTDCAPSIDPQNRLMPRATWPIPMSA